MENVDFPESNGGLGAPRNWNEAKEGPCGYLNTHHDGRDWTSCWKPTDEDLKILNGGGCIYLGVCTGDRPQPPVSMYAGHRMWTEGGKDHRLPDPVEIKQGPLFLVDNDELDLHPRFAPWPRRLWLVAACLAGGAILTGAFVALVDAWT